MRKRTAGARPSARSRRAVGVINEIVNEINEKIAELEGEDWHDDDRSRRATINGLKIARRVVEQAAAR
jgi:hypothetical protein